MFVIYLEKTAADLVNTAFTGNISKLAIVTANFKKYVPNRNEFMFQVVDRNGSGSPHICKVDLKEQPTDLNKAIELFNTQDIRVFCSCADFKYRREFKATRDKYNTADFKELRPTKETNPYNTGSVCKHLQNVLKNFKTYIIPAGKDIEKAAPKPIEPLKPVGTIKPLKPLRGKVEPEGKEPEVEPVGQAFNTMAEKKPTVEVKPKEQKKINPLTKLKPIQYKKRLSGV
jgi:hypothetical protein